MSVALSGNDLTFPQLYDVALRGEQVHLTASAIERMNASRAVVDRLVASGATAYGINTGFGKLASVRISAEQVRQLQVNLVRSHACGVGAPGAGIDWRGLGDASWRSSARWRSHEARGDYAGRTGSERRPFASEWDAGHAGAAELGSA